MYTVITKENWIEGGGDKVSVHFAVTFLDRWRTSFCVTTIIKIVNNNTNNKQTSGPSLALDGNSPYTNSCLFTLDRMPPSIQFSLHRYEVSVHYSTSFCTKEKEKRQKKEAISFHCNKWYLSRLLTHADLTVQSLSQFPSCEPGTLCIFSFIYFVGGWGLK